MGRKERINEARAIFENEISSMLQDSNKWKRFLDFSSQFYKYSFTENLLMFAQRPEVTMCATLEQWNSVGRYVIKDRHGIRLIDDRDNDISLKYVFDVTDTWGNSSILSIKWKAEKQKITNILKDYFDYEDIDTFEEIVQRYVVTQLDNNLLGNLSEDESNLILRQEFMECIIKSTIYQVAKRSDVALDIGENFDEYNFITDKKALIILGTSVNKCSNELLRIIEYKVKQVKKEEQSYGIKKIWNDNQEEHERTVSNQIRGIDDRGDNNGQTIGERAGDYQAEGDNRATSEREKSSTTNKRVSSDGEIQSDDREHSRRTITANAGGENLEDDKEVEQSTSFSLPNKNVPEEIIVEALSSGGNIIGAIDRIKKILKDEGLTLKEKASEIKNEYVWTGIGFPDTYKAEALSKGISITDKINNAEVILSWTDVTKRLQKILGVEPVQMSIDSFLVTNDTIQEDEQKYDIQENLLDYSSEEIAINDSRESEPTQQNIDSFIVDNDYIEKDGLYYSSEDLAKAGSKARKEFIVGLIGNELYIEDRKFQLTTVNLQSDDVELLDKEIVGYPLFRKMGLDEFYNKYNADPKNAVDQSLKIEDSETDVNEYEEQVIKKVLMDLIDDVPKTKQDLYTIITDTQLTGSAKTSKVQELFPECFVQLVFNDELIGDFKVSNDEGITIKYNDNEVKLSWIQVAVKLHNLILNNEYLDNKNFWLDNEETIKQDISVEKVNFKIPDDYITPQNLKLKYKENIEAIKLLRDIESENRLATPEEQEILARYNRLGRFSKML